MTLESPHSQDTPADGEEHLSQLRSLLKRVMEDGKISQDEARELRAALMADGQITPDELDLFRTVIREQLGDKPLEFE